MLNKTRIITSKGTTEFTESKGGYDKNKRLGIHKMTILSYADDAVLIAASEDDLEQLHSCNTTAKTINMKIPVEKTKWMVISKEPGIGQ